MKKDYIIPTIFLIKYEEESKLLDNSIHNAASVHAAPDVDHNAMGTDNTKLNIDNTGNSASNDGFAKKTDWFFDDNAFSDF